MKRDTIICIVYSKSFFLLLLAFMPVIIIAQHDHALTCDHRQVDSKQGKDFKKKVLDGFVSGWTQPHVIDVAIEEPYHWVYVTDYTNIDEITFDISNHTLNGVPITELVLHDDGVGNDEVAGDNIFTSQDVVLVGQYNYVAGLFFRFADVTYLYNDGSTTTSNIDLGFGIRILNSANVDKNPLVTNISSTVQYSSHVMNIKVDLVGQDAFNGLGTYTNQYYSYFPDTKDVLMFATCYPTPDGPAGSYSRIQAEETGVQYNLTPFDNSASYGSAGKLKGLMRHFYTYGGTPNLVNHEFMHQFGVNLHPDLELTISGSHWGVVEFPSSGFGSGYQRSEIIDLGMNCFDRASTNYTSHFNTLEQYLMGLISINDVDWPLTTLADWTFNGGTTCPFSSTTGTIEVTQLDFENLMGPRVPNVSTSQKDFDFGMIVLSKELLSPQEMAYYNWQMIQNELPMNHPDRATDWAALNFEAATYGLGTLKTKLPCPGQDNDLVILDDPIPHGLYEVNSTITASTIGAGGGEIIFDGGTLCLEPGFEIPQSVDFLATLNNCGN